VSAEAAKQPIECDVSTESRYRGSIVYAAAARVVSRCASPALPGVSWA